jgi:hypothetical protein
MSESKLSREVESTEGRRQFPRISRKNTRRIDEMMRRVLPDAVDDDGVSPLDVCLFNSSL